MAVMMMITVFVMMMMIDGVVDANSETLSGRPQSRVASSLKTRSSTTQDGDSLQVWF